ncbi:hypothetical protein, partial [Fulvivirga aurantia]|uniref:hypothetical protein n=1 Tax=Fulvivirga aurantia TaxID=2529383 RepID=UPI001628204B
GWNIDTSPGTPSVFSKQSQGSLSYFQGRDTDGDVKWYTDLVDLSSYPSGVIVSYDIAETGALENADYIELYYNTLGDQSTPVANRIDRTVNDFGNTFITVTSGTIVESQIQLVVVIRNNTNAENHYFRNVRVRSLAGETLYSRANGDWNDGINWSTIGYGGATCNCSPDETTPIFVGNGNTVDITSDSWVNDVTVDNTGTLQFTNNDLNLNVEGDGVVTFNSGSTFTDGATAGSDLDFEGNGSSHSLVVNSGATVSFNTLQVVDNNPLTISGAGSMTIENIVEIFSTNTTTFSHSGTINVINDFNLESTGTLIFNGTGDFNVGGDFDLNDTGSVTFNGSSDITITNDMDFNAAASFTN